MRRTKQRIPTAMRNPRRQNLRNVIRWALYVLCILIAFLLANTGDYAKPIFLIPIALCISSVSGSITAGSIGIACGFLLDISSGTLLGYHAILLFLLCLATSLLYDRLMQQRFLNMVFFTLIAAFFVTGSDYIFRYAIWGHENVSHIYLHYSLPCVLYTGISGAVCYPIFFCIHRFLLPKRRRTVEKTLKPMTDE